jgi:hypothetical protein
LIRLISSEPSTPIFRPAVLSPTDQRLIGLATIKRPGDNTLRQPMKPMPTFPAVECPSFGFAARIIASTDTSTFASLGMVRSELDAERVVALMQADWMQPKWCFAHLRKRVVSPPMLDMVETLRQAHREALDAETELRAR